MNLLSISPVDGRYHDQTQFLSDYFSEFALIKARVYVELQYLISLSKLGIFTIDSSKIEQIYSEFDYQEALRVKEIESTTKHDVKAVEYYLKQKMQSLCPDKTEWVHFGLTSQDINNVAIPYLLKSFITQVYLSKLNKVVDKLNSLSNDWFKVPMLSRTHGQPASPTTMGKELMVFVERLENQIDLLNCIPDTGKFGGAVGNFNAHYVAFPDINWVKFADDFLLNSFGLIRQRYTTQIEHYDNMGAIFDTIKRINVILMDLSRDMWQYISLDYFKLKRLENEIGSSTMPHKVNPIDFENAEGNLGIANANFEHLSSKLPQSRLQRDLTDSTVLRNIGVPISHTIISINSLLKGLDKLVLNQEKIGEDLDNNWVVITEAIQTILRREGYGSAYEKVKEITKNEVSHQVIVNFIMNLDVTDSVKSELLDITPQNYIGFLK